jgi:hypothetical protein
MIQGTAFWRLETKQTDYLEMEKIDYVYRKSNGSF